MKGTKELKELKEGKRSEERTTEDKHPAETSGVLLSEGVATLGRPSYLRPRSFFLPATFSSVFLSLSVPLPTSSASPTMIDRNSDSEGASRAKRQKMSKTEVDPRDNPYLAHMYESSGDSSRYADGAGDKPFGKMKRRQTTATQAKEVEDGATNPFNGQPFSNKYFSILKGRRDLPVHAQR